MALRRATNALFALSALTSLSHAATPVNVFTSNSRSNNTGATPTWQLGQTVTVTWNANYDTVDLGYMAADDTSSFITFYTGTASSWTWQVNVNQTDWSAANVVYYMVIADHDNPDNGFYSLPVYIVQPGSVAPTSASTASHTQPTSIAQAATTIVQTVTQPPPTPTTTARTTATAANGAQADSTGINITASDPNKLGTGTIAGIAVGAVAGVAALIAAIFFVLRNKKLKKQIQNTEATTRAHYMPYDQLPPNSGVLGGFTSPGMGKDAAFGAAALGGAAAGAGAGAAAAAAGGYYADKHHSALVQEGEQRDSVSMLQLPQTSQTQSNRISEMPAEPFNWRASQHQVNEDPVEIGGTELTRPMDEQTPSDARPLMGEHPRDTTE